eukprot:10468990-Ditylum_brightwellii.AAC.1
MAGPVMCEEDGSLLHSSTVEEEFHAQLLTVQHKHPHLIGPDVEVEEKYTISRSIWQGSLTCTTDQSVDTETRDLQNRWSTIENKQGSRA